MKFLAALASISVFNLLLTISATAHMLWTYGSNTLTTSNEDRIGSVVMVNLDTTLRGVDTKSFLVIDYDKSIFRYAKSPSWLNMTNSSSLIKDVAKY